MDKDSGAEGVKAGPRSESAPLRYVVLPAASFASEKYAGQLRRIVETIVERLPAGMVAVGLNPSAAFSWSFAEAIRQDRVRLLYPKAESPWTRDFFPEIVRQPDGRWRAVQFRYFYPQSYEAGEEIARLLNAPLVRSPLVMEGGNFVFDDRGRLFLTEHALDENRDFKRQEIEDELKRVLLAKEVHWLPELPEAIEPTGHLDMYASYLGGDRMLVADSSNPQLRPVLELAAQRFAEWGLEVSRVANAEHPKLDGVEFGVLSYTNALLVGKTAFVPTYAPEDPRQSSLSYGKIKRLQSADQAALAKYRALGFDAVPVPSDELLCYGGGAVHCVTKHVPKPD